MKNKNVLFLLGESHAPDLIGTIGHPSIKTPNLDSWMKRLRSAGYETVGIGKMHYRSDDDDNGFSQFIETMHIADGIGDLVSALRYDDRVPIYQGLWNIWTSRYGAGDNNPYRLYDERITNETVNWLTNDARSICLPWAKYKNCEPLILHLFLILIHFVGMTPQLFDLSIDREEARNLANEPELATVLAKLMGKLCEIVDPEKVDTRAKKDQRKLIEAHGGREKALRNMGGFSHSPPPGMSWKSMNQ